MPLPIMPRTPFCYLQDSFNSQMVNCVISPIQPQAPPITLTPPPILPHSFFRSTLLILQ
ncbi:hypothetical protein ES319_D02G107600v1 [Gossypium barbadense]|uniref:Uncharacterized protein n=2 Tax=Gossypium TaxID=3633 RepID=A0A5J5SBL0_GOSBA|nr:hypothetical protein ES319_D02G107600v1 [Gossypium barbadense]TYG79114.1 hypothetical protein ES288_D02G115600v1 [Gossypium darwinii]